MSVHGIPSTNYYNNNDDNNRASQIICTSKLRKQTTKTYRVFRWGSSRISRLLRSGNLCSVSEENASYLTQTRTRVGEIEYWLKGMGCQGKKMGK